MVYLCDSGYDVVGDSQRECLCSEVWSGSEPICQGTHTDSVSICTLMKYYCVAIIERVFVLVDYDETRPFEVTALLSCL